MKEVFPSSSDHHPQKKTRAIMSAMMERNQNVQHNQQGQQTVQDVFTKEKILAHCAKIDELAVRITRRSLFSRRKRGRITSIFKTYSEQQRSIHLFSKRGCTHLPARKNSAASSPFDLSLSDIV